MLNDHAFRIAFVLSLTFHFFAISAGDIFAHKADKIKREEIEVTYITVEPSSEKALRAIPRKYDLKDDKTLTPNKKQEKQAKPAETESGQPTEKSEIFRREEFEQLEEYIQYYRLVREKIKEKVASHYDAYDQDGRVDIVFTLGKNGALKNAVIDESKSDQTPALKNIALVSVKKAAPFPPFPARLNKDELTFSITIIFKRE